MRGEKVSTIIVTWNNDEELDACLYGLSGQLLNHDEVIIIHNRGAANLLRNCESLKASVTWIMSDGHPRFSTATNVGIQASTGDLVFLLNADWLIQEDALAHMLQCFAANPAIGAVSGQLRHSDGTIQIGYNVRRFPTALTLASDLFFLHKILPGNRLTRQHRMLDFDHQQGRAVDIALGCALLIRRSALEKIGLFDFALGPAWVEDMDFCLRLNQAGYALWYCPAAKFVHIDSDKKWPRGATTKHLAIWGDHTLFYRSYLRYSRKHFGGLATLVLRLCIMLGMIARIGFSWFTPGSLRRRWGRRFKLYDPDEVIRKHRRVYWDTLRCMLLDWSA